LSFPPAAGIGSTFPKADAASTAPSSSEGFAPFAITVLAGEAKFLGSKKAPAPPEDNLTVPEKPSTKQTGKSKGLNQLMTALFPTLDLICARASIRSSATKTYPPKVGSEDFILGIIYNEFKSTLYAFVPFWHDPKLTRGPDITAEKGWYFAPVKLRELRVPKPPAKGDVSSATAMHSLYRDCEIIELIKQHTLKLTTSLTSYEWPDVIAYAYAHWQGQHVAIDTSATTNPTYSAIETKLQEWRKLRPEDKKFGPFGKEWRPSDKMKGVPPTFLGGKTMASWKMESMTKSLNHRLKVVKKPEGQSSSSGTTGRPGVTPSAVEEAKTGVTSGTT
jgi:hypothetical protein